MAKPKITARPPLRLIDCRKGRREASRKKTAALLLELSLLAKQGDLDGVMLCVRYRVGFEPWKCAGAAGVEQGIRTGCYQTNIAEAVNAAERIKAQCLAMQDDLE